MTVSIIVPTYKERENLPELFTRIFAFLDRSGIDGEVIVVDDDSRDGTERFVTAYGRDRPVDLVVRRGEKGLASACVAGFRHATGDILLVMDADLQHPPEKIPELLAAIQDGADIAIGSRYVSGGSLGDWGIGRKIMSRMAASLASLFFNRVAGVRDMESGFFAFKKDVIQDVDLQPKGYKILLEILVLGDYTRVTEVGFRFGTRSKGESKLGMSVVVSYLAHLWHLLRVSGTLTKLGIFCIVGLIGVAVNLAAVYLLTEAGVYYLVSGAIAIELSLLTNFFLNRSWTFKAEAQNVGLPTALARDHVTRSVGIAINLGCLYLLTELAGLFYMVSMLIGIGLATLWNYLGNVRWVWASPDIER